MHGLVEEHVPHLFAAKSAGGNGCRKRSKPRVSPRRLPRCLPRRLPRCLPRASLPLTAQKLRETITAADSVIVTRTCDSAALERRARRRAAASRERAHGGLLRADEKGEDEVDDEDGRRDGNDHALRAVLVERRGNAAQHPHLP